MGCDVTKTNKQTNKQIKRPVRPNILLLVFLILEKLRHDNAVPTQMHASREFPAYSGLKHSRATFIVLKRCKNLTPGSPREIVRVVTECANWGRLLRMLLLTEWVISRSDFRLPPRCCWGLRSSVILYDVGWYSINLFKTHWLRDAPTV